MNWKSTVAVILAAVFVFAMGSSRAAYAAPPTDACALLTPAQVSAVLGISAGPGKPLGTKLCQWGPAPIIAKSTTKRGVMLTLQSPMAFAYAKMPVGHGIVKTPVSGIGDDAVYGTTPGYPTVLTVKKGNVVFVVHVNGFSDDQIKAKEKMLGQDVLAKL